MNIFLKQNDSTWTSKNTQLDSYWNEIKIQVYCRPKHIFQGSPFNIFADKIHKRKHDFLIHFLHIKMSNTDIRIMQLTT
jgi:hypothetical protein